MSDFIKHECGIAHLRLLKPLEYYINKYGTAFYGLNKMYLMMEKQHNRGQDGAGLANVKLHTKPGARYISRYRSIAQSPIKDVFQHVQQRFEELAQTQPELLKNVDYLQDNYGFTGEVFLGHVRYGTFGRNSIENCHPFLRQNNWRSRNLTVAGNFNMTNVDELFDILVKLGQHPKDNVDTVIVMEKIGHFLDMENQRLFDQYKTLGHDNQRISELIADNLDVVSILQNSAEDWDGGYVMGGIIGHGDSFVLRDPHGIRPCHYYADDEIVAVASERPVLQTAFNLKIDQVKELTPGHALIVKRDGFQGEHQIRKPLTPTKCSFERIYFSRGSDNDIYKERKALGRSILPQVLNEIEDDLENTVFSYIPNTAELAFYGLMEAVDDRLNEQKTDLIAKHADDRNKINEILKQRARFEKVAIKDAKLRTFITQDDARDDMVAHVYDISYGTVRPKIDNLVVIDDSIVRGTTLRQSIIRILNRLEPKQIVVVSSAPQIRYPDCYGIDMSRLGEFVAFQAAIALLKETGKEKLIDEVYQLCKSHLAENTKSMTNHVKKIFAPFTAEEISAKISELLTPEEVNIPVKIIYQSIEGLHEACPNHTGDWYFTGDFPTVGGNTVVNRAFTYYVEGRKERAY